MKNDDKGDQRGSYTTATCIESPTSALSPKVPSDQKSSVNKPKNSKSKRPLRPSSLFKYALQGAVLGAIASTSIFVFSSSSETFSRMLSIPWYYPAVWLGLMCCSWFCTASRFWLLCRSLGHQIPYHRSLEFALSIEFGVVATPGGLGGTAIFLTLLRQEGIPLPTGTSIWLADLASDAFFFAVFSPIAVYFALRNSAWSGFFQGLEKPHFIEAFVVLSMFCILMVWAASKFSRLQRLEALTGRSSFALRKRIPARLRLLRWKYFRSVRQIRTT